MADLDDSVFDAKQAEGLQRVRAHIDAGADFLDLGGLLVDRDLNTAPMKGERRGKPADATADDGNLGCSFHRHVPISLQILSDDTHIPQRWKRISLGSHQAAWVKKRQLA